MWLCLEFLSGCASRCDCFHDRYDDVVDEGQTYQMIEGLGAAFADSAISLLEQVTPSAKLASILRDLFTRNGRVNGA